MFVVVLLIIIITYYYVYIIYNHYIIYHYIIIVEVFVGILSPIFKYVYYIIYHITQHWENDVVGAMAPTGPSRPSTSKREAILFILFYFCLLNFRLGCSLFLF